MAAIIPSRSAAITDQDMTFPARPPSRAESLSDSVQAKIIRRAVATLVDAILDAIPEPVRERRVIFNPFFVVADRERLIANPATILPFLDAVQERLAADRGADDARFPDITRFSQSARYIIELSRQLQEDHSGTPDEQTGRLRALDQTARIIAFLSPQLAETVSGMAVNDPPLALPCRPADCEPATSGAGAASSGPANNLSIEQLVELAQEQDKHQQSPDANVRVIVHDLPQRKRRWLINTDHPLIAAARPFAKGAILGVSIFCFCGTLYESIKNGANAVSFFLTACVIISVAARLFGTLIEKKFGTEEGAGNSSGGPSGSGAGDASGDGADSSRSCEKKAPEPKPVDRKKAATQRRRPLGQSAASRQVDILHGGSDIEEEAIGELRSNDPNFFTVMSVCEPYVVISRGGGLDSLRSWIQARPVDERSVLKKALFRQSVIERAPVDDVLDPRETEIKLDITSPSLSLPLPAGYGVTAIACFDSNGSPIADTYPILVERCLLGSFTAEIPKGTAKIVYRVTAMTEGDREDVTCLNRMLPVVPIHSSQHAEFLTALGDLSFSPNERAQLCHAYMVGLGLSYSDDFFAGTYLRNSRENLAEALLGLRTGTCDPFAFLLAVSMRNAGVPAFVVSGLVPKVYDDGIGGFKGDCGHSQTCAFADNVAGIFDLTVDAQPASYDPLDVPPAQRAGLLREAGRRQGDLLVQHAEETRAILEQAKAKCADHSLIVCLRMAIARALRRQDASRERGHSFKNTFAPMEDAAAKILAVQVVRYCTTLARLIDQGRKGVDVMAPCIFFKKYPAPPQITPSAKPYLPQMFHALIDDRARRDFSTGHVSDYLQGLLGDPKIPDAMKTQVIDWCVSNSGDAALLEALYRNPPATTSLQAGNGQRLSLPDAVALYQGVATALDDDVVKKLTFGVSGSFVEPFISRRDGVASLDERAVDGAGVLRAGPAFIDAVEREFSRRSMMLSDDERCRLTQMLAWLARQSREVFGLTSRVEPAIYAVSGKARDSQRTFINSIATGPKILRDACCKLFGTTGVSSTFEFADHPVLKSEAEMMLGTLLVKSLPDQQLDDGEAAEHALKEFWAFSMRIPGMGLRPSVGHEEKRIARWIDEKTRHAAVRTRSHFNIPAPHNPASFFSAHRGDSVSAALWQMIERLRLVATGLESPLVESSWYKADEQEVAWRVIESLEFYEEGNRDVCVKIYGEDSLCAARFPVHQSPSLIRLFLPHGHQDGAGAGSNSGSRGELAPVYQQMLSRLPLPSPAPPFVTAVEEIKSQYPELWERLLDRSEEFGAERSNVLQNCLRRLTDDLASKELYSALVWAIENVNLTAGTDSETWNETAWNNALIAGLDMSAALSTGTIPGPFEVPLSPHAREIAIIITHLADMTFVPDWVRDCTVHFCICRRAIPEQLFCYDQRAWSGEGSLDARRARYWKEVMAPVSYRHGNDILEKLLPEMEDEVAWICRTVPSPWRQYLFSRTGHVVVRGDSGEFDEFRPFQTGDDIRRVDWLSSARAGRTMVRTYIEEESRHLNLIYDLHALAKGIPARDDLLRDLIMHVLLAEREGLDINLILVGRSVVQTYASIQRVHPDSNSEEPEELAYFRTDDFWESLLQHIEGARLFFKREEAILSGGDVSLPLPGPDIFACEMPQLAGGRINYFVLSERSVQQSNGFLNYLRARGEMVELVTA